MVVCVVVVVVDVSGGWWYKCVCTDGEGWGEEGRRRRWCDRVCERGWRCVAIKRAAASGTYTHSHCTYNYAYTH